MPCLASCAWNPGRHGSVFQRHPRVSVDRLSVEIALSATGLLLAHLCRWNPPDAISSSSWVASVLASSGDSQDVAKSSTYILHSTSDAARGTVAWCRRACTLTVLTAKNGEQVKSKHTLRLGLLLGFEPGGTCSQYPPVGQPGSGESKGEPLTDVIYKQLFINKLPQNIHSVFVPFQTLHLAELAPVPPYVSFCEFCHSHAPAQPVSRSLRNALSRQTPRGISVLRLLPCRPHGAGGTMCALGGRTLLLVQPSLSPDTAAWLTNLITTVLSSLDRGEPAHGLFDVDRKVRLAFAPQETKLVSLSVKEQGFLKSFHHPCILRCDVIIWGNSHCFDFAKRSQCSVCLFLYFRQEDPRFLTRA
ncbi:hypothetical protein T06_10654 [Trichinella sp. T6]|nr:hypothetical protein T06_10654 [Trichinella sp. T6]